MIHSKSWHEVAIDHIQDARGSISIAEKGRQFPFDIRRMFFVANVGEGQERGHHAHEELKQFIFATSGSFIIDLDDGKECASIKLSAGGPGIFLNGPVWRVMRDFSSDAVMMVLCDRIYAEDKVLRDYDEFKRVYSHAK